MTSFRRTAIRFAVPGLLTTVLLATTSIANAANWRLDLSKSKLGFSGTQAGTKFQGTFTRYNAVIEFDPDHLDTSHIAVSVDLASATTNDRECDAALPGKDWFDAAQFPTAKFETSAIRRRGADDYEAVGTLTLRGVTKPLVLPFSLETNGTFAHAKGHAELIRSAFGIGQGPWTTDQWVALNVGVDIDVTATREN
jgi:polyisoprenoid-binding protein YceI